MSLKLSSSLKNLKLFLLTLLKLCMNSPMYPILLQDYYEYLYKNQKKNFSWLHILVVKIIHFPFQ